MQTFSRIFFRGLVTLIPIALTIYIVYQAVVILENMLGTFLRYFLQETYIPGLGLSLTLISIFIFGLILNTYVTQRLLKLFEQRLNRIPFVKAIYSPLRDLMNLFSRKDEKDLKSVVLVQIGEARMIGLVTRDTFNDLSLGPITEGKVAVYVPFSYALGGYTFLMPKSSIQKVDVPIEKAMSLAITGWVKTEHQTNEEASRATDANHPR